MTCTLTPVLDLYGRADPRGPKLMLAILNHGVRP